MAKILIVDDEAHMRLLVSSMLKTDKYELLTAENGDAAVEMLQKENVDLLITDLVMPMKNGIDLIMELKHTHPKLKIIAMSGGGGINGRFDYLPIAKLIGAENILRKPFKREELSGAVMDLLAANG